MLHLNYILYSTVITRKCAFSRKKKLCATFRNDEEAFGFTTARAFLSRRSSYFELSAPFFLKVRIYFPRMESSCNLAREKRPYPSVMTGNLRVSRFP